MRKDLLIIALGLFAAAGVAGADVLSVPETESTAGMTLPAKGTSMADVEKQFGEPIEKKSPVGGDTPKHPPITRWDYDGFVVIFEKDRVVDAVVPGAPPKLRSTSGLTPAADAPALPAAPPTEAAPEAEPIIPEAPASEPPPPMEPAAEAAPAEAMPEPPPPVQPEPPPAEPAAPFAEPAPEASPSSQEVPDDAPPTPK